MKKNMSISLARFPGVGRTPLFALSLAAALCMSPLSRGVLTSAPSTDVVVVAVSGTTYNTSGPSAGIVCVGTSTITVYPGTTLAGVEAGLQSQDGSVQDWIAMDSGSNILTVPSTVLVSGDTLTVVAADGTDQYIYGIAAFNNPTQQGMPGGINPVTGWQEGNYWNEALYFQIDSTVNANRPNFPNYTINITDPKYAALVTQITEGSGSKAVSGAYYYGTAINQAIIDCNAAGGGKAQGEELRGHHRKRPAHPDLDSFDRDPPVEMAAPSVEGQMVPVQSGVNVAAQPVYLS